MLGVPRSTTCYRGRVREDDQALADALRELGGQLPTAGHRYLTECLRRIGHALGRKRVLSVMRSLGYIRRRKASTVRTTNSKHEFPRYPNLVKDLRATRPDEIWVTDITYIRLATAWIYLAVIMDVYTRASVGGRCGDRLRQR